MPMWSMDDSYFNQATIIAAREYGSSGSNQLRHGLNLSR
jgi:hypothetical protein